MMPVLVLMVSIVVFPVAVMTILLMLITILLMVLAVPAAGAGPLVALITGVAVSYCNSRQQSQACQQQAGGTQVHAVEIKL
jgi:hypothetical protein